MTTEGVGLEILIERFYQSGRMHNKERMSSMTALYNQDMDLEDPYMEY